MKKSSNDLIKMDMQQVFKNACFAVMMKSGPMNAWIADATSALIAGGKIFVSIVRAIAMSNDLTKDEVELARDLIARYHLFICWGGSVNEDKRDEESQRRVVILKRLEANLYNHKGANNV